MNFPVSRFLIAGNNTREVNIRGLFLISSFVLLVSQWTKLKRPVCIFPLFPHRFGKTFSGVSLNCQCFSAQPQEHQLSFFFFLFHSLPCQRNEANAAAPQGSSCLLPYNNFWIHWPNPSQFESQWGSQSYSALSYVVRQLRGLLLLHQRKATELTPSRTPQWDRDTRNSINSPAQIQSWHQHSPVKLLLLCRHLPLHRAWFLSSALTNALSWRDFSHLWMRTGFRLRWNIYPPR